MTHRFKDLLADILPEIYRAYRAAKGGADSVVSDYDYLYWLDCQTEETQSLVVLWCESQERNEKLKAKLKRYRDN